MNRKQQTNLLFILFAAMSAACGGNRPESGLATDATVPVRVQPLGQQVGLNTTIHATGLFTTDDETLLSFKNGGVVDRILVKEGDAIRKGQLLATTAAAEIQAAVQQATLALEKAERDYNRARKLYLDSVATQEQMQNAQTAMEVARQQLQTVKINQGYGEIRAATGGFVLQRFVNEGQVVGPGTPVLQVNSAGNTGWMVNVGLSDRQWAQVSIGDSAAVTTDALPGKKLHARVTKKTEGASPASGLLNVQLTIEKPEQATLASGLFGRVEISARGKNENWTIPFDALIDADGGRGVVFVTNDGKTARRTEVIIGGIEKDRVLITGGLEQAAALIVSGSPYLKDGAAIEVRQEDRKSER